MFSNDLDPVLVALADSTRRAAIDLLSTGPRRAGELAQKLDLTPPGMSKHLRILRRGGLVEEERDEEDARVRLYRLRREPFEDLNAWLGSVETFWAKQLDSFSAQVKNRVRRKKR